MTKLNDYLAKVQSDENKDLYDMMISEYEFDPIWNQERVLYNNLCELKTAFDARTKDIQVLCEIVSIYKDKIDLYLNHDPNINWLREAVEEIDQLITERIEG